MSEIDKEIKTSKNYQLESLIQQFERFEKESVVNTTSFILKEIKYKAKKELELRGAAYQTGDVVIKPYDNVSIKIKK